MRAGVTMGLTGRSRSVLDDVLPLVLLLLVVFCTATAQGAPLERAALASMLRVAEPGVSDASRVELPWCSESCAATLAELAAAPARDFTRGRLTVPGWSRPETAAEGMARYAVIARAIARVAEDPPSAWRRHWPGLGLARALVTIARHESAFWRAVHDGTLRGEAGEACLVQVHPDAARALGIDLESLVGLDSAATERCFRAGAELLARARRACEWWPEPWFLPAIALYATGDDCNPERFAEVVEPRWRTWELTADRRPLPLLAELALAHAEGP